MHPRVILTYVRKLTEVRSICISFLQTNKNENSSLTHTVMKSYLDKTSRSFKRQEESEWAELKVLSEKPRMALVEPTIATESAGSFTEGTLVLMLFDPARDSGYYKCEAEYITLTVGSNQTYTRAEYKISGNGEFNGPHYPLNVKYGPSDGRAIFRLAKK